MELRIREVDEGGGGLTETRASEAKGPFPGGKRVGSWGKKKNKRKEKAKERVLLLKAMRQKKTPPTSSEVDGVRLFESH